MGTEYSETAIPGSPIPVAAICTAALFGAHTAGSSCGSAQTPTAQLRRIAQ